MATQVIPPAPKPTTKINVTNTVRGILTRSRMARNSDRHLFLEFLQGSGMDLSARQVDVFLNLPSLESVRRVRQKLQETGNFPADAKVASERDFKSMQMQQITPSAKPEFIQQVLE